MVFHTLGSCTYARTRPSLREDVCRDNLHDAGMAPQSVACLRHAIIVLSDIHTHSYTQIYTHALLYTGICMRIHVYTLPYTELWQQGGLQCTRYYSTTPLTATYYIQCHSHVTHMEMHFLSAQLNDTKVANVPLVSALSNTCLPMSSARMILVSRAGWVDIAWRTAVREHPLLLSSSTAWMLATSGLVEDLRKHEEAGASGAQSRGPSTGALIPYNVKMSTLKC